MKRTISLLLALMMLLTLAACGTKPDTPQTSDDLPAQEQGNGDVQPGETSGTPDESAQPELTQPAESEDSAVQEPTEVPVKQPETSSKADTPAEKPAEKPAEEPAKTEPSEPEQSAASSGDSLSILTTVWDTYGEEDRFPAMGGDSEHPVDSAPGSFDIGNTDNLSYLLTFPAEDASLIDGAASLVHMMNMNTFTCGAFHAVSTSDMTTLADDLHTAIQNKRWMCGFPDKLVIVTLDQYVVSMYGNEDLVNTFCDKLFASYSAAAVVYDEAIG